MGIILQQAILQKQFVFLKKIIEEEMFLEFMNGSSKENVLPMKLILFQFVLAMD
jgi:hypothetical protein